MAKFFSKQKPRVVKFRAWDSKYQYMNYKVLVGHWSSDKHYQEEFKTYTACSMYIEPSNVDYECRPHWGHFEYYHEDVKLMQFSGEYDKNKQEIYEGDILSAEGCWSIRVEFRDGCFVVMDLDRVRYLNRVTEIPFNRFDLSKYEVVGNIYEHPHLLERGK